MRALAALCCCFALGAQGEVFNAKVIAVMDGDTIMVLREGGSEAAGSPPASPLRGLREGGGQRLKVRLANIDAPEKDQPFGKQSQDSLLEMVGKKQVNIESMAVDQYGRTIGLVSAGGLNVNQEQIKRGMAWEYSHYHEDKTYVRLQSEAQQARRGLWAQSSPLAPWLWRKTHPTVQHDTDCGNKRLCTQMSSCDEANFYLTHCGVLNLDGNHDGIPCENLCGGRQ